MDNASVSRLLCVDLCGGQRRIFRGQGLHYPVWKAVHLSMYFNIYK